MDLSLIIAVVAVAVVATLWISRDRIRQRRVPADLEPGNPLPGFSAVDEQGKPLASTDLLGTTAVLLFVRGTWCPFCSKQVQNLTKYYKEINNSGARLILITPRPLETTRRVADFFEVDFEFWLDESLSIARNLGLVIDAGVPADYQGEYGNDTVWPTSLVIDSEGVIRHTELSRFVADRPNPQKLLRVVSRL